VLIDRITGCSSPDQQSFLIIVRVGETIFRNCPLLAWGLQAIFKGNPLKIRLTDLFGVSLLFDHTSKEGDSGPEIFVHQ